MIKTKKGVSIHFANSGASLDLIIWPNGRATLANVYSRRRGYGYGRAVMEEVCAFCDDNGIALGLRPESYGPGASPEKTKQLRGFYEKFGFKHTRAGWLIRKPKGENG